MSGENLPPIIRKYVVINVNSNAVINVNVKLIGISILLDFKWWEITVISFRWTDTYPENCKVHTISCTMRTQWCTVQFFLVYLQWNIITVNNYNYFFNKRKKTMMTIGHHFSHFYTTCLSKLKDHWRWFSTRNAHMLHIVILIRLKRYKHLSRSLFLNFNYLVSVTAGGPVSPQGHM